MYPCLSPRASAIPTPTIRGGALLSPVCSAITTLTWYVPTSIPVTIVRRISLLYIKPVKRRFYAVYNRHKTRSLATMFYVVLTDAGEKRILGASQDLERVPASVRTT